MLWPANYCDIRWCYVAQKCWICTGNSFNMTLFPVGDAVLPNVSISICTHIYGCGSKCKVWIKPRSHTRSRPPIQTSDPDLSKGFDPDLWSRPLEWYNVLVSWCLVQWWLHVIGFPALHLFTLRSSQATNCCKATLPSCHASKLHLS